MPNELLMHRAHEFPNDYDLKGFELALFNFESQITRYGDPLFQERFAGVMGALTGLNDDMNNGLYPADLTEKTVVIKEQLKAMITEYTESGCYGF